MSDVIALCYHAVSPTWTAELSVTPDELERQLDFCIRRGWQPATFADAMLAPPSRKTMAVTFDDGFLSVKRYALPILERYNAPATVFVPTAFMDCGELGWPGVDHWLSTTSSTEMRAMTWDDLGELAEVGWEIGSHTRTHPRLTQLADAEVREQLEGSQADCVQRLGRRMRTISYPYGDVDDRIAALTGEVGFVAGAKLSTRMERLGPLRQPTIGVYHSDSLSRFRIKVARPVRAVRSSRLWPSR